MPTDPVPPMVVRTRSGEDAAAEPFDKPVILPAAGDNDPARHAWADARFASDIMAEHGLFFALLMPPEGAGKERTQALRFAETFAALHQRIAAAKLPAALAAQPGTVAKALTQHPETSAVLGAAETILAFKTQAARDIQAARSKTIIDPRLADQVRREALKFVDELRRAV